MPQNQVISYPVPYYNNNIPMQLDFFQPSRFVITNVTLGQTTIIETSEDHDYVIGQLIRLFIPKGYGCTQLTGKTGYVVSIPDTDQVEVTIDSSINVNQFIAASETNSPAITAIGDGNSGIISSTGTNIPSTNIPGAFINIS
jgi:hypothetical protein